MTKHNRLSRLATQVVYFHCDADADSPCGAPHKAFNSTSSRPIWARLSNQL